MKIFIDKTNTSQELEFSGKAFKLLEQLQINPETVILARGGELVTLDEELDNTDEVKIISVLSGG